MHVVYNRSESTHMWALESGNAVRTSSGTYVATLWSDHLISVLIYCNIAPNMDGSGLEGLVNLSTYPVRNQDATFRGFNDIQAYMRIPQNCPFSFVLFNKW